MIAIINAIIKFDNGMLLFGRLVYPYLRVLSVLNVEL